MLARRRARREAQLPYPPSRVSPPLWLPRRWHSPRRLAAWKFARLLKYGPAVVPVSNAFNTVRGTPTYLLANAHFGRGGLADGVPNSSTADDFSVAASPFSNFTAEI